MTTLLPGTVVSLGFAFAAWLRFSGDREFRFFLPPRGARDWNLVVFIRPGLALLIALGLEWNTRNRSRDREAARAELENRYRILQIRHQLDANDATRAALSEFLTLLEDYCDSLG
jgi:hypothetical protein